jgi:Ca-activated chloride channel family protein
MNQQLPILSDDEVRRCLPTDEESGFGALATSNGLLPLKAMDVRTRIDGLLAETTICQTFVNTLAEPLEATYIFPLPDRAAVTRFRMEVGGRLIEGTLKERSEARREYDEAIQAGHRAAITEEDRAGVFNLRVGNLMPGEQAVIRLTLTGPLEFSEGETTFRFPLVVAPRYIPGNPLPGQSVGEGVAPDTDSVPDASRISPPVLLPGFPNPVQLSLSVEIHRGGMSMGEIRSSLHAVTARSEQDGEHITVQPGERLNRDFILRFRVGEESVQPSLVLQADSDGNAGTFLLTLMPPAIRVRTSRPRDAVFILDRSGSMQGWKMAAARRALGRMVDTFTDRDRLAVYAFDDSVETVPAFGGTGLVPATNRNRFRAVEFLAKMNARGGTELARPLDQAVKILAGEQSPAAAANRDLILVLVTDGQVGNEDQILQSLGNRVKDLRIFTLGIDQAVNAAFLRRLASLGGGSCELVESEDRLDEVMDKVHRRIDTPVLSGLKLAPDGLEIEQHTMVPERLPDLFAGTPLTIMGRYRGGARGQVVLKGQDAAGRPWTETVRSTISDTSAIATVWARGQVRQLEDRYAAGLGDRVKLEKHIMQTSLKFGVLCRFTAYVAVDVKEVVNPDGKVHRVTQPVEPAAGWEMLGTDAHEQELCRGGLRAAMPVPRMAMRKMDVADVEEMAQSFLMDTDSDASAPGATASSAESPLRHTLRQFGAFSFGRVSSRPASAEQFPTMVELTAYRRRTQELLDRLRDSSGKDDAERLAELGFLSLQLEALVEDLKSTGASVAEVRPLVDFLNELKAFLAQPTHADRDLVAMYHRADEVLHAFSTGSSPAEPLTAKRREGFWK